MDVFCYHLKMPGQRTPEDGCAWRTVRSGVSVLAGSAQAWSATSCAANVISARFLR